MSARPKIVDGIQFTRGQRGWKTDDNRCLAWGRHDGTFTAEVDGEILKRYAKDRALGIPKKFKTLDNAMRAAVKGCYPPNPLTASGFALVNSHGEIILATVCCSRITAEAHLRVRYAGKGARIHPVTVIVERT